MQRRTVWLGLGLLFGGIAAVLGVGAWLRGATAPPVAPAPRLASTTHATAQRPSVDAAPEAWTAPEAETLRLARGPVPASLAGSEIDGGLSVDAAGHFRPDADALALFEYFLAATGEEPIAVIRQRILIEIGRRLDAPADAEATRFLDRYLEYREALRALAEGGAVPPDLDRRLQWLRELRRAHFGADTTALFGLDEATVQIDLERRRVFMDPELEAQEKAEQLAALDDALPERVRAARARANQPAEVRDQVRRLRAGGADDGEVFAIREAAFGTDAATRLAALDEDRRAWDARLDRYRAEREALLAEIGLDRDAGETVQALSDADRARLDALRQAHFEEREVLRVQALDATL